MYFELNTGFFNYLVKITDVTPRNKGFDTLLCFKKTNKKTSTQPCFLDHRNLRFIKVLLYFETTSMTIKHCPINLLSNSKELQNLQLKNVN